MKTRGRAFRFVILMMSLIWMAAITGAFSGIVRAAKNKATTIRLVRTEGSVTVKNSKMEELVQTEEMRLYSGDHQITEEASYAWMSLDDTKAIKLDENSETELRKKWSKLEVLLDSGSVFFNVTVPLAEDETLNIRSSTMITGVRGTCGWVRVMDGGDTRVYLLEGSLECLVTNPINGDSKKITLKPGQYADFYVFDEQHQGDLAQIVPASFGKEDIEPYVLAELLGDQGLINKIYEQSGIDLRDLTPEDVAGRKDKVLQASKEAGKNIRAKAAEQDGVIAKDPVWSEGGAGDAKDDSIVYLTMPQTATTVQRYLDMEKVKKVVLLPGKVSRQENTLKVDIAFKTPAGKTLEATEGVPVVVEDGKTYVVDGTASLMDQLENNGVMTVNSSNTLEVHGIFENHGTVDNTSKGRIVLWHCLRSDGILQNAGVIEPAEGASGDSLIFLQGGNFQVTGGRISAKLYGTIVEVSSEAAVSLNLSGGVIANEKDGGTTISVREDNFKVEALGTDVCGVTDTLLGASVDPANYDAATVWRTDERYHLIALAAVDSYPVIVVDIEHGSITAPGRVEVGAEVPLSVVPDAGYELDYLSVNQYDNGKTGASVGISADHVFVMPKNNVIVSGRFVKAGESKTGGPGLDGKDPEDKDPDGTDPDGKDSEKDPLQNDNDAEGKFAITLKGITHGEIRASVKKAKENDRVTLIPTPETGYEFETLTVTTAGGKTVKVSQNGNGYAFTMPAQDVVVTAGFKVMQFTLTFYDADGRTVLDQQVLPYGTIPVYAGGTPYKGSNAQYDYSYAGWKNAAGAEYRKDVNLPAVTGNENYTVWFDQSQRSYTITFYDEDGTTKLKQESYSYGSVPNFGDIYPKKTATPLFAYDFAGWKKGDNTYALGEQLPSVNGDAGYTAVFSSRDNICDVIWKHEDGTVLETDDAVAYGDLPSYDGILPTKAEDAMYSYVFGGWTDGTNTFTTTDALPAVTERVTYTAVFTRVLRTYTVTWKNEDGTILETDQAVPYGEVPEFNGAAPKKDSDELHTYSFNGWFAGEASFGANETLPVVTGDITYTAYFSEADVLYQVSFDANGKTVADLPAAQMLIYGARVTQPADPGTGGYTFAGWYKEAACENAWDFGNDTVTGATVLYAKWTVNAIQGTLTLSGSEVVGETLTAIVSYEDDEDNVGVLSYAWMSGDALVSYGTSATYTLTANDQGNVITCEVTSSVETGSLIAYTGEIASNLHSIQIGSALNGTVESDKPEAAENETVTLSVNPEYGYELGLIKVIRSDNTELTLTENVDGTNVSYSFSMPNEDVTVTAGFEKVTFTVTFDENGHGETPLPQQVKYEEKATAPDVSEVTGYEFDGWYKDDKFSEEWDFDVDTVTEDITLIAKWTMAVSGSGSKKISTICYGNGGKIIVQDSADPGVTVPVRVFVNDGYHLTQMTVEWVTIDNSGKQTLSVRHSAEVTMTNGEGSFEMPNGDVTVRATILSDQKYDIVAGLETVNGGIVAIIGEVLVTEASAGELIELEASPDQNYRLSGIYVTDDNGDMVDMETPNSFYMPESSVSVDASFERVYAITNTNASEAGNRVYVASEAAAGEEVSINIVVASVDGYGAGYQLEDLVVQTAEGGFIAVEDGNTSGTGGSNLSYTFTMPEDEVTVTAVFLAGNEILVSVADNVGGTLTVDTALAKTGQTVTITATPDVGYTLASVKRVTHWNRKEASYPQFTYVADSGVYQYSYEVVSTSSYTPPSQGNVFIATFKPSLTGTLTLSGEEVVGKTITATVTDPNVDESTLYYEWYRGEETMPIASGSQLNTYTLTAEDSGLIITCTVHESSFETQTAGKLQATTGMITAD